MFHRLRMTNPAVVAAALTLMFTMADRPRDAFAFLTIDWASCRPEIVTDWDEHVLRRTGREICDLVDVGPGIIFRPEPRDPAPDRRCTAKTKKAEKAMDAALQRLRDRPNCAATLNGTTHSAEPTLTAVRNGQQYDACAGAPPDPNKPAAARAAANEGPNTDIEFFNAFFGSLGQYDGLKELKNDDLRRQMIVLHEIAHATGREMNGDDEHEKALNRRIVDECFGSNEKSGGQNLAATVDANGVGVYPDATSASNDANDGVLGDDGSGEPPTEDVFTADPDGSTIPPDDGGGGGGGDIQPFYAY